VTGESIEAMADHWWWRPGWTVGRRFYTWHLTFAGQRDVQRLAAAYRTALADVPGLDLIPDEWLHLTMQGIGFVDEVETSVVDVIVEAARVRLAAVEPFTLEFTRPGIDPESVHWALKDSGPAAVRTAIRAGMGTVLPDVPENEDGFRAHVSIAYSSSVGPAEPVYAALKRIDEPLATARITAAQLIVLHRDRRMYEWTIYASVPLGA
jgi:2'-5' RNA ligase